jgi:hypothetical protein
MPPLYFFEPPQRPLPQHRPRRVPTSPAQIRTRIEALLTGLCVAAGLIVASMTLPPPTTPGHAAEVFVRAMYDGDWPAAWRLLCQPARQSVGSFDHFAEQAAQVKKNERRPRSVRVFVDDIRLVRRPQPVFTVAVTVETLDLDRGHWREGGDVRVTVERGGFRACPVPT